MNISKTWWGQRFLQALENFTDPGRLKRGRSYASDERIKTWSINNGLVKATVRGNVNPYFGVYKEPRYHVRVQMKALSNKQWQHIIAQISENAGFISRLLLNEIPENIETVFQGAKTRLLPADYDDFTVSCDCPDYATPCKHIAGVCYRLAQQFDQEPFLLFAMRGLAKKELHKELLKSPLGKILADAQQTQAPSITPGTNYFTRPKPDTIPEKITLKQFWHGKTPLPQQIEPTQETMIPALLVKKGGDYPPFWSEQNSFITVMEDFYVRMRKIILRKYL